jgi:PiT family inorganic phosphate transporter
MSRPRNDTPWKTLDKDLGRIGRVELASRYVARPLIGVGLAAAFIALAAVSGLGAAPMMIVAVAAALGAYMAINIGANDMANNMGPAVGAKALSMGGALAIAAVAETSGALLAGGGVVATVAREIIDPAAIAEPGDFVLAMLAALAGAALWVNLATWIGAPVSTTHSVIGGVMGAGVAAAGLAAVNWSAMGAIAAAWVMSPVLGGVIAAGFLWLIKAQIVYREDRIAAARRWVPILIGIMAGAFAGYIRLLLGAPGGGAVAGVALGVGLVAWIAAIPQIERQSLGMENRARSLKALFHAPLVLSAALLSFAHGANDVANAVGPVAAIVSAVGAGDGPHGDAPMWVMVIGAFGISLGLFLFGPRLVRLVGEQITRLNPMRAYCVALSAAVTVILASALGLPVSSTHVAVGGVFGVGFFREWHTARRARHDANAVPMVEDASERRHRRLVRRSHFMTVLAAWVITTPAAAALAAAIFTAGRLAR